VDLEERGARLLKEGLCWRGESPRDRASKDSRQDGQIPRQSANVRQMRDIPLLERRDLDPMSCRSLDLARQEDLQRSGAQV